MVDKDADVRQATRQAVQILANENPQAEKLIKKWIPAKGDEQRVCLEIINNGNKELISPKKLRKQASKISEL